MSYILEALKKSDQERQRRSTPGIQSVYAVTGRPAPRRGKLRRFLLIPVLLLGSALLVWQHYPLETPKPAQETKQIDMKQDTSVSANSSAAEKRAAEPGAPATLTAQSETAAPEDGGRTETRPPASPDPPPAPRASAPTVPPAQSASSQATATNLPNVGPAPEALKMRTEENKPPAIPELKKPADPASSEARRAALMELPAVETVKNAPAQSDPQTGPLTPAKGYRTAPESSKEPVRRARPGPMAEGTALAQSDLEEAFGKLAPLTDQGKPAEQAPPSFSRPKPSGSSAVEQQVALPELQELPQTVRNQIPEISFSMFVYSKEPASRLVGVKGQVVREGQDLAPGLKLEQITPNGAILNFRGQRFIKKMF